MADTGGGSTNRKRKELTGEQKKAARDSENMSQLWSVIQQMERIAGFERVQY